MGTVKSSGAKPQIVSLRQTDGTLTRKESEPSRTSEIKSVVQKLRAFAQKLGEGASDTVPASTPPVLGSTESTSPLQTVNESYQGDGGKSVKHEDKAWGYLKVKVDPSFKFKVVADMSGALYENNNALSKNGQAKRINGAAMVANFGGALYANNVASSSDGKVFSLHGVDIKGNVTDISKEEMAKAAK